MKHRSPGARMLRIAWPLLLLTAAVAFPLVVPDAALGNIAVLTLIYATAASAWNCFSGYTGYNSLGHATFFGFGAYAIGIISANRHLDGGFTPFLLVPVGGVVAALIAIPLGWIELRTRGHAFVIITLISVFIF